MLVIKRKAFSASILTLLLTSMFTVAFNVQHVKTETQTTIVPMQTCQWVWTNKQFYMISENVTIFMHNSANLTLEWGGWWIETWNGSNWITVYLPIRIMVIIPIEPCEVITGSWDQKGSEENPSIDPFYQVPPGTYRVVWQPHDLDTEEPYGIFTYAFTILGVIIIPAPPAPPQPNYIWADTNETFLYLTYEEITYLTGLVFGIYIPETIELDKKHSIYIYAMRIFESEKHYGSIGSSIFGKNMFGFGNRGAFYDEVSPYRSWFSFFVVGPMGQVDETYAVGAWV